MQYFSCTLWRIVRLLLLVALASGIHSAWAVCSSYLGKVVFNELQDPSSGTTYLELRVLDPSVVASTSNFQGWRVDMYKNAVGNKYSVDLNSVFTNLAKNNCGQQSAWIRIPDADFSNQITGSGSSANLNFVLYETAGSKIVDVFRIGAASSFYGVGTNYTTCSTIENNIASTKYSSGWLSNGYKDWYRYADGTGVWGYGQAANNANSICTSNDGSVYGQIGLNKVASASTVFTNTNFSYTLYAQNSAIGSSLSNVAISDNLTAAGLTFVGCTPTAPDTCTYNPTSGILTWTVASLPVSTTRSAVLTVQAATAGVKTNTITASSAGAPTVSTAVTVVTPPTLSVANVSQAEGNSGTANMAFTITQSAASVFTTTVSYATSNGTATGGSCGTAGVDYATTSGTATIAAGATSTTVNVPICGDALHEAGETFTVTLSSPINATLATATATGTITNDDTAPTLSVANVSMVEGDSGTSNMMFTITQNAISGLGTTVNYATSNGSATGGSCGTADVDYATTSGTANIPAGSTTATFFVPICGDVTYEGDESFTVTLSVPVNATITTATATGTIRNDDGPPLVVQYLFEESSWNGTAGEVKDTSGNNYHATAALATNGTGSPGPAYTLGSQSTCRYAVFDVGSTSKSYIRLPDTFPGLSGSFSFTGWINSTNATAQHQRIFVRDDNSNGWALSLADGTGTGVIRFFNRNVTFNSPSGGSVSAGGVAIDTTFQLSSNTWYLVAFTVDTVGKTAVIYVYDTSGTQRAKMSASFTGTWGVGTGATAIGGETSASTEGQSTSWHFLGRIDEVRIYSGALTQTLVETLLPKVRTCGASVNHYELALPSSNVACLASTITLTACADNSSPCTNPHTAVSGSSATLSTSGASLEASSVTFNASGVANTTLSYPGASDGATATVTLTGTPTTASNALQCCPNGSSCAAAVANSCSTTFNTAGFIISDTVGGSAYTVPTQIAGTASPTLYLRAIKTSSTTGACGAALSGANTVNWANQCNNPTTCDGTNRMSINGGTATTIQGNPNTGVSTYTPVAMTFDANGNAPFTFNYADAGQVTLYANKAAGGSLLTSLSGLSNAFVVRPASLAVSGVTTAGGGANPGTTTTAGAAFMAAGENFTVKVQGLTSGGAVTPNFGNETPVPSMAFVNAATVAPNIFNLVAPAGGNTGVLTTGTSANGNGGGVTGTVVLTGNQWSEVGAITLKPYLSNYLSGGSAVVGAESGTIGRFRPYQYGVAVAGGSGTGAICGSGNTAYAHIGQPLASTWTVTAQNKSGGTASNYGRGTPTLVTLTTPLAQVTVNGLATGLALDTGNALYNVTFAAGQDFAARADGTAQIAAALPVRMNPTPAAPIRSSLQIGGVTDEVGIVVGAPIDLLANGTSSPTANQVNFELGRIRLNNAYGSELLDLPMTMLSEFWNGTGWVLNNTDTCTNATLAFAAVGTPNITGNTCVWDTGTAPGNSGVGCAAAPAAGRQYRETGVAGFAGDFNLWLRAPGAGNAGSIDVTATVPAWLQYNWRGTVANPTGRATFGVYRSPLIYRRENY